MKRRSFLGLLAGATCSAMLNVFPAFAPEPRIRVYSTRWHSRNGYGVNVPFSVIRITG